MLYRVCRGGVPRLGATSRRALLTRVGLSHRPARTVACCVGEVRPLAERHAFGHPRPPSRCHPMGGTGRSHRGLSRRMTVSTSKALRARVARTHALVGPVPICFRPARELALQHDLCERCSTCVRGRGGGADEVLFRLLLDPRRACPQHAWASDYSVRPSRSTPGRCHGCTGLARRCKPPARGGRVGGVRGV